MIQYDPPAGVVGRWQPALDLIAPRTDEGHAWLSLEWEPGEEWSPVGRWIVWECMPIERAPEMVRKDLTGPNPRNYGRWDPMLRQFVRTREFSVSRAQWLFYQRTGAYGYPFWVVQGKRGGHRRRWSDVQSNLSLMHGGPAEPPDPGDLPYAVPDERTILRLKSCDLVERYGDILRVLANDADVNNSLDLRERAVAREMARQVYNELASQMDDALEAMTRRAASEFWDEMAGTGDWQMPDYDARREEVIEEIAASAAF